MCPRLPSSWFLVLGVVFASSVVSANDEAVIDADERSLPRLPEIDDVDELHEIVELSNGLVRHGVTEGIRILAAVAAQDTHEGPRHHAREVLRELGVSIDAIPGATAEELGEFVKARRRGEDEAENLDVVRRHVENLVRFGRLDEALRVVRERVRAVGENETDERGRVQHELLHEFGVGESEISEGEIVEAFRRTVRRRNLGRRLRSIGAVDLEAAELARELFRQREREREEDWDREREEVRKRDDDRERDEDRDQDRDDDGEDERAARRERRRHVERATSEVLERAVDLAKAHPQVARTLAETIVVTRPESLRAELAEALLARIPAPVATVKPLVEKVPFAGKDPAHDLFESGVVREYALDIPEGAIASLREEPKEYVRATFREGDRAYTNIGVRLKGGWGSFRKLDGRGKTAFTVKFDAFEPELRFHGLRRIILNNAVQDSSFQSETLGYALFRAAGIPAPRTAHATLTVNGERYGLYVQIEAVTKEFLARWFEETGGNLYEGPGDVLNWRELDLDANQEKNDRSDLRRLVRAIEEADDDDPWASLRAHVDLPSFARFVALEQILNHWDGYNHTNNYRVYHDPSTKRFWFIPHGPDQLFDEPERDVERGQQGILARALLGTESGREYYRRALREIIADVWNPPALRELMATLYVRLRPHVAARPRKGRRGLADFEERTEHILRFIEVRDAIVRHQLDRNRNRSWRERPRNFEEVPPFHQEGDD